MLSSRKQPPSVRFALNGQNGVFGAEWVGRELGCARIVGPLAVHDKTVFVNAARKADGGDPAFGLLFEGSSAGIPAIESAGDGNRLGLCNGQFELYGDFRSSRGG